MIRHDDLVSRLLREVASFSPTISMIKERIESLISREFMKRDDNDYDLYLYVAGTE